MHIPDGFLTPAPAAAAGALAAAGVGVALWHARATLPPRRVPLLGLSAAFVFAAQMLNFPVAAGTSGHLIGGVLSAVLLGPSAAVVVLTAVLILQAFLFADGGVLALGANLFNMAIVQAVGGYLVYRAVHRLWPGPRGQLAAIAFAAWCGTVLAALACAGELALSGRAAAHLIFPAMGGIHMLIGLGEAVITTLIIAAVGQARPELLATDPATAAGPRAARYGALTALGLLLALGLTLFVAPFASPLPDGLDHTAELLGFAGTAADAIPAPAADYKFPGLRSEALATALAGAVGALIAFALAVALAWGLSPKGPKGSVPTCGVRGTSGD